MEICRQQLLLRHQPRKVVKGPIACVTSLQDRAPGSQRIRAANRCGLLSRTDFSQAQAHGLTGLARSETRSQSIKHPVPTEGMRQPAALTTGTGLGRIILQGGIDQSSLL